MVKNSIYCYSTKMPLYLNNKKSSVKWQLDLLLLHPDSFRSLFQRKVVKIKVFLDNFLIYSLIIRLCRDVHFIWRGAIACLAKPESLIHLAAWLIIMPAEAPSKVTNCLYLLPVSV